MKLPNILELFLLKFTHFFNVLVVRQAADEQSAVFKGHDAVLNALYNYLSTSGNVYYAVLAVEQTGVSNHTIAVSVGSDVLFTATQVPRSLHWGSQAIT